METVSTDSDFARLAALGDQEAGKSAQEGKASAGVNSSSDTSIDPLLTCLEHVAKWHGMSVNSDDLLAGLPLYNDRLTPELLLRAAERAGFEVRVVKRAIRRLSVSTLPAILILQGGQAGVLEPDGERGASLFLPGENPSRHGLSPKALKRLYTGYTFLLRPRQDSVDTASLLPQMDKPGGSRWWFWGTIWRFRREYARLLPASLLVNLFALGMPLFIMTVYDRVVPNDAEETLWVLAFGIFFVFCYEFFMRLLRGYLVNRAGKRVDSLLASALYEHVMAIEMKARPASSGELANRTRAYESLREFFTSATLVALADVPFSLLIIGLIFFLAGPVGWIPVGTAFLAILFGCMIQMPLRKAVGDSYRGGLRRQSLLTETINGLESVKGGNAEGALQRRMERMVRDASEVEVRSHWYSLLATSTTTWLIHMTTIGLIVASVYRVYQGDMTMGAMIACIMLAARGMTPLAMVAGLLTRLQQSLAALKGLNEVMALPRESGGGRKFVGRTVLRPRFSLREVGVSYPNQIVPALQRVSLEIKPGERIGLIGKVGSGKSTLLRILAKLYEPAEGEVLLDGLELGQYHPASVRRTVGYLPQDAAIFFGSLKDNILLGTPSADDNQLLKAVRRAGLEEFINKNPLGLHTPVGEQGILLSGGQKQSLALARTMLMEPRLLLLDEPTANMDVNAEKAFVVSLKQYLDENPERTLVLSTHKLSLLQLVDRLLVLDDGRLVADGDKTAVMNKLRPNQRPKTTRPTTSAAKMPAEAAVMTPRAAAPKAANTPAKPAAPAVTPTPAVTAKPVTRPAAAKIRKNPAPPAATPRAAAISGTKTARTASKVPSKASSAAAHSPRAVPAKSAPVRTRAKKTAKTNAKKTVKKAVKKSVKRTVKETAKKTAKKAVQKSTSKTGKRTSKRAVKNA